MHFFSPAQRDEAARGRARRATGTRRAGDRDAAREDASARPPSCPACATASSATACSSSTCAQAMFLVEEGATPAQVDARAGGVRHGDGAVPHERPRRPRHRLAHPQAPLRRAAGHAPYSRIADRLCEQGRFGQKTGAGWYRYEPGGATRCPIRRSTADRRGYRDEIGVAPRKIGDEEIVERCVFALVNEGARDPRGRHRAARVRHRRRLPDRLRLPALPRRADALRRHASACPTSCDDASSFATNPRGDREFWTPAPLLARLAAEGETFNALDRESLRHDRRRHRLHRPHPLAKSWRGAFNMTHGATLGGHVVRARDRARARRPGRGRRCDHGLRATRRARPAATSRGRSRCAPAAR